MNRLFGGGQAAVETAVAAVPLLVVAGAALYLCGPYRRYGRPRGWSGVCTMAALSTGAGRAAYAVWPLPASVDGLCAGTAADALVRPDRAGVADPPCGVRVSTRSTLVGGLPSRLVRYAEPREEALAGHPAVPLPGSAP